MLAESTATDHDAQYVPRLVPPNRTTTKYAVDMAIPESFARWRDRLIPCPSFRQGVEERVRETIKSLNLPQAAKVEVVWGVWGPIFQLGPNCSAAPTNPDAGVRYTLHNVSGQFQAAIAWACLAGYSKFLREAIEKCEKGTTEFRGMSEFGTTLITVVASSDAEARAKVFKDIGLVRP